MPSYTVAQLISRAKAAADMHDDFVTEAQWIDWFNVEHKALSLFIARAGWVQTQETGTVTITGLTEYTPTFTPESGIGNHEPLAILGVFEQGSDGRLRRLVENNLIDGKRQLGTATAGPATEYTFHRDRADGLLRLRFYPVPTSGTYNTFYIPHPSDKTATTDTVSYAMGWEERIVVGLAARAVEKEEGDAGALYRRAKVVENQIEEAAWSRNLGQAPKIRNVDKVERGWMSPDFWPPPVGTWYFP